MSDTNPSLDKVASEASAEVAKTVSRVEGQVQAKASKYGLYTALALLVVIVGIIAYVVL